MLPVRRSASGQLGLLRILDFTSTVCVRFVSLHATDRLVENELWLGWHAVQVSTLPTSV